MTLRRFVASLPDVPMATGWYPADLAEAKGRQQNWVTNNQMGNEFGNVGRWLGGGNG